MISFKRAWLAAIGVFVLGIGLLGSLQPASAQLASTSHADAQQTTSPIEGFDPGPVEVFPSCEESCAAARDAAIDAAAGVRIAAYAIANATRDEAIQEARDFYDAMILVCNPDVDPFCLSTAARIRDGMIEEAQDAWRDAVTAANRAFTRAVQQANLDYDVCIAICNSTDPIAGA